MNYGGGKNQAMKSLELSEEVAEAMVTGWSASFPEVAHYQNMVIKRVERDGYAENMYGRRYYLSDTNKAYKVGNYLVQGSCADMLKEFMIRIDLFLSKNNCKTKMLLNVHDEIQLLVHEGEEWIFPYIKKIMENVPWMLVPVEVGLEVTETTWADKKEVVI